MCREEKLEEAKATFARVTSQHVYSVEPAAPPDLSQAWLAEVTKFKALLGQDTPEAEHYLDNRWSAIAAPFIKRKAFGDGAFRWVFLLR